MKSVVSFIFLFTFSTLAFSLTPKEELKLGNKEYSEERYHNAIEHFESVVTADANNAEAHFKLGVSYLETGYFEKALEHIQKSINLDEDVDEYVKYWEARALHVNYQFDQAIKEYQYFLDVFKKEQDIRRIEIETLIEQAKVGQQLYASPKYFLIHNLGETINSEFHDHSPLVSGNGNMLIYTSQRSFEGHSAQDFDGHYYEAIFVSEKDSDGNWKTPYTISTNSTEEGHEACIQVFDNDSKMLVHNQSRQGDIFQSEYKEGKWQTATILKGINSNHFEVDASISPDGKTIIFATDHFNKKDRNLDLYTASKESDGTWGKPTKLGENINTVADENSPFVTEDGNTLYFCSNGKNSMGGYDIFKSIKNSDGTWGKPNNLGYPVNSVDDDVFYHVYSKSDITLFASARQGGYGELDLYESTPIPLVKTKCKLLAKDTKSLIEEDGFSVSFTSTDDNPFAYQHQGAIQKGLHDCNLLSNSSYNIAILKGSDTVFKESNFSLDLAKTDNESIDKVFEIEYINPSDTMSIRKPKKDSLAVLLTNLTSGKSVNIGSAYFDYKSAKYKTDNDNMLTSLKAALAANSNLSIKVVGHTDNIGSQRYNLKLSKKRALATVNYLTKHGIEKTKITSEGLGKLKPIVSNKTKEGRAKNRRTEINVIAK